MMMVVPLWSFLDLVLDCRTQSRSHRFAQTSDVSRGSATLGREIRNESESRRWLRFGRLGALKEEEGGEGEIWGGKMEEEGSGRREENGEVEGEGTEEEDNF
eukprot:4029197-Pleurochrysis_carterae.AAC.3